MSVLRLVNLVTKIYCGLQREKGRALHLPESLDAVHAHVREKGIPPLEGTRDQLRTFDTALHSCVKLSHGVFIFE